MMIYLFGILFVIRIQPVFIVTRLIIITFIYSFYIFKEIGRYWFRYVLLIVILRGVLVVFTYIVTLTPNERFEVYSLVIVMVILFISAISYGANYLRDSRIISLNLWINYLGTLNLFLVRFLLIIILLVVYLRNIIRGAFHVNK